MNRMYLIGLIAIFLFSNTLIAQDLGSFDADLGKKSVKVLGKTKEVRAPYLSVTNYYGYIKTGSEPDAVINGKKMYFLYLWIPLAIPELGVRMISPIPKSMNPEEGDFVGADFTANAQERSNYFDTWITLERADMVVTVEGIANAGNETWTQYGVNDDSGEMPSQPSGSFYNSLMRISSDTNNPQKALVRGLYRIGFTTYKTGEVQGSFLAQLGATLKLPGVAVSNNLNDLVNMLNQMKEKE